MLCDDLNGKIIHLGNPKWEGIVYLFIVYLLSLPSLAPREELSATRADVSLALWTAAYLMHSTGPGCTQELTTSSGRPAPAPPSNLVTRLLGSPSALHTVRPIFLLPTIFLLSSSGQKPVWFILGSLTGVQSNSWYSKLPADSVVEQTTKESLSEAESLCGRGNGQRQNKSGLSPVSQEAGITTYAGLQEQRRGDKSDEKEEISMYGQAVIAQGAKRMEETKQKKMKAFLKKQNICEWAAEQM